MTMLIVGVLMWSLIHLVPSILPGLRSAAVARIGEGGFKGVFALGVLASIVLMVFGWMEADQYPVYMPPSWGASASMVIILVAFVLMGLAHAQSNIKRFIRHPQLTGLALWSIGHLLSNGDNLSLILFGWLGLWAVLEILLISIGRQDGCGRVCYIINENTAGSFQADKGIVTAVDFAHHNTFRLCTFVVGPVVLLVFVVAVVKAVLTQRFKNRAGDLVPRIPDESPFSIPDAD